MEPITLPDKINAVQNRIKEAQHAGRVEDRYFWMSKLAALREEWSAREPAR
jgi:hypothetical protein